jgi:hypothetical protein
MSAMMSCAPLIEAPELRVDRGSAGIRRGGEWVQRRVKSSARRFVLPARDRVALRTHRCYVGRQVGTTLGITVGAYGCPNATSFYMEAVHAAGRVNVRIG